MRNHINIPKPQYFHQVRKGSTVIYGNKTYRVQEDRGNLHIILLEDGHRKKKTITQSMFIEPGTITDFALNEWFNYYTPEEFFSYASAELNWVQNENANTLTH